METTIITRDNVEKLLLGISRLQLRKSDGPWETLLRIGPTAHSDIHGDDDFYIPCKTSSDEFHPITQCDFDSEGRIIQGGEYTYRIKPEPARIPTGDIAITRDNIEELLKAGRIERQDSVEREWEAIYPNGPIERFDLDEQNAEFTIFVPYKTESGDTDTLYGYDFDDGGKLNQDEESYYTYRVVPEKPPMPPPPPQMRPVSTGELECPYCGRWFSSSDPVSLWHRHTCKHAAAADNGAKEPSSTPLSSLGMARFLVVEAAATLFLLALFGVGLLVLVTSLPSMLRTALVVVIATGDAIAGISTPGWILIFLGCVSVILIAIWLGDLMKVFRYSLLASALLVFFVTLSFTFDLIFDGTAEQIVEGAMRHDPSKFAQGVRQATATFRDDFKIRLVFGVAWVVFMLIVTLVENRKNRPHSADCDDDDDLK